MQDPDSESHTVISIHAPTRGATYDCSFGVEQASISIHAPTRGATNALLKNPYVRLKKGLRMSIQKKWEK